MFLSEKRDYRRSVFSIEKLVSNRNRARKQRGLGRTPHMGGIKTPHPGGSLGGGHPPQQRGLC